MARTIIRILVAVSLSLVLLVSVVTGATIRVPGDQPTIQAGIDAAVDGDTVMVADGIFHGEGNRNILILSKSISLASRNGPYSTIIDCEKEGYGVELQGEQNTIIHGFTIENGEGGILCDVFTGSPEISDCIIKQHTAHGIDAERGAPIILRCSIMENTSTSGAGLCCYGEYWYWSKPTVIDCLFYGNDASRGGAVFCGPYSGITLNNCTIYGNTATYGGGIFGDGSIYSIPKVNVDSCILWENTEDQIVLWNASLSASFSDIQGGWIGEGNLDLDPFFVDAMRGDFRLLFDSPCIDAGNPDFIPRTGGGHRIDMGAIEYFHGYNFSKGSRPSTKRVPADFPTIQAAINAAVPGDTVLVADGTYIGEENTNIDFLGKPILVTSENGSGETIIDCEFGSRGFCIVHNRVKDTELRGFTVRNGYLSCIKVLYSELRISDCIISNSSTDRGGGGISITESNVSLHNCIIADNFAEYGGGGIFYQNDSQIEIENCIVTENASPNFGGGGLCSYESSSTIYNTVISQNNSGQGGGFYSYNSNSILVNCILWENAVDEVNYTGPNPEISYSNILGGWEGEGNIDADPRFFDPENGDFRLTVNSPCIDTGDPTFKVPLGGGSRIDMGAYEYWHGWNILPGMLVD